MNSWRWLVRGGGPWWFRWSVRLAVVAAIAVLGFLPYRYEIGGDFRVAPEQERGVRALLADELAEVRVRDGQDVAEGYVVGLLSAREEQSAFDLATAELKQAQAGLDLLQAGSRPEDIELAQLQLELFQTQSAFRESELARVKKLRETNSATPQELDSAKRSFDVANSMVEIAKERLGKVKNGSRPEEVRAAEAEVEAAKVRLELAGRKLALREIKTPIAGRINAPGLADKQGQFLQEGELLAVVQKVSRLHADMAADEAAAANIQVGMPVKLRLNGTYGQLLWGKVRLIHTHAQPYPHFAHASVRSDREQSLQGAKLDGEEDRFVAVIIDLDDREYPLVPGMTGYARVVVQDDYFWNVLGRSLARFFRVDVWSWLP